MNHRTPLLDPVTRAPGVRVPARRDRTSASHVPRTATLLMFVGVIAGGCSPDATIAGPDAAADPAAVLSDLAADQVSASAKAGKTKAGEDGAAETTSPTANAADAVDDALTRLVPSLGSWGLPLRDALLRLQTRPTDESALTNLQRAIATVSTTRPDEHRADLDALRLALGISESQ